MHVNDRLWAAAEAGSLPRVKRALAEGAVVDAEDEDGHTPLMSAAWHGNLELVKYFVDAGADPNRWAQGDTPLARAAEAAIATSMNICAELSQPTYGIASVWTSSSRAKNGEHGEADTLVESFIRSCDDAKTRRAGSRIGSGSRRECHRFPRKRRASLRSVLWTHVGGRATVGG